MSAAHAAVSVRQVEPATTGVTTGLAAHRLVRTWAMRGTLHCLPTTEVADYLGLMAAGASWRKPSWQRAFLPESAMAELAELVSRALEGRSLTRQGLAAEIEHRASDPKLVESVQQGWGAVLKPLAFQGLLCNGDLAESVTFVRPVDVVPGWDGITEETEAAAAVIPRFLSAYGPATPDDFDAWLSRGSSGKRRVRGWFDSLDTLVQVDVDGTACYVNAEDVEELLGSHEEARPVLLGGFDPLVLGIGTANPVLVAPERRSDVSRPGGWISPVVVRDGRVVGVWDLVEDEARVRLFAGESVSVTDLEHEAQRWSRAAGRPVRLTVTG